MSEQVAIYPRRYVQGLFDETIRLESELKKYRDAYLKLRSVVNEVCLYKIYEDYGFNSDRRSNYYIQPVVFPLVEFENTARRARLAIKEADEILNNEAVKGIK